MRKDAKLTKREIKKAARLYILAMLINDMGDGGETDEEMAVAQEAFRQVEEAFLKEFPGIALPLHFSHCIDAIKGMRE